MRTGAVVRKENRTWRTGTPEAASPLAHATTGFARGSPSEPVLLPYCQAVGSRAVHRDRRIEIVWEKDLGRQSSRKQIRILRIIRVAAKETLRQNHAIQAILLYGSRARGDHRRGSDYDIAVVSSLPRMKAYEASKSLYDDEMEKNYWTELVFTSPEDLARYANTAGTLESRLAREGILIAGEWKRPDCREGRELNVDGEKALEWAHAAMANGLQATMWLRIATSEAWRGDNGAATRVRRMAGQVTKGISLGAAAYNAWGQRVGKFSANLEALPDATADDRTIAWWEGQPEA